MSDLLFTEVTAEEQEIIIGGRHKRHHNRFQPTFNFNFILNFQQFVFVVNLIKGNNNSINNTVTALIT